MTETARGRHIGAALLDAAFAEAIRRGAYAAALESGHQRAVATGCTPRPAWRTSAAYAWSLSEPLRRAGTDRALTAAGADTGPLRSRGSSEVL